MTRKILLIACAIAISCPAAADEFSDALLPVNQFVDAMNRGDLETAFAACGDEMAIIDNVAPYQWHGKDACTEWADAQQADSVSRGFTDLVFRVIRPTKLDVADNNAYAVLPASYTFNVQGHSNTVQGIMTATLTKTASGWKMSGFAFSEQ